MTHAVLSQASQSLLITHISVFAVLEFCVMVQVAAPAQLLKPVEQTGSETCTR